MKTFRDDEMIIALGVTVEGKKVILGFIEGGTEHASVCKEFLTGLLDRGLMVEQGVLCVMDGSKRIQGRAADLWGIWAYSEVSVA